MAGSLAVIMGPLLVVAVIVDPPQQLPPPTTVLKGPVLPPLVGCPSKTSVGMVDASLSEFCDLRQWETSKVCLSWASLSVCSVRGAFGDDSRQFFGTIIIC